MQDILALVVFFWSGLIVIIMIINSLNEETDKRHKKPTFRWAIVVILSIVQTGCLEVFSALNTIGNGSAISHGPAIIFSTFVIIWLVADIRAYKSAKK